MMQYQHRSVDGSGIELSVGKAVCVGRNYAFHIQELNNPVPDEPLLFIKPNTTMMDMNKPLLIPEGQVCHNELEVALLVAQPLQAGQEHQPEDIVSALWGIGLALDLTLREKQDELKKNGHPWERSKAFDNSCPLSGFVPMREISDLQNLQFKLWVNDNIRQSGDSANMMYNCISLIQEITGVMTLLPGDVILTGTPEGVGPLYSGDKLSVQMFQEQSNDALLSTSTNVV